MPSTNANTHEWLREVRHDLHAHPELAFKEFRTTERIIESLSGLGRRGCHGFSVGCIGSVPEP